MKCCICHNCIVRIKIFYCNDNVKFLYDVLCLVQEVEKSLTQAKEVGQKSADECRRLEYENSQLSSELQRLKQGFVDQQSHNQQLRDQVYHIVLLSLC